MLDRHASPLFAFLIVLAAFQITTPLLRAPISEPPTSLGFIANVGQIPQETIRFYSSSPSMQVGFVEGAVLYRMQTPSSPQMPSPSLIGEAREEQSGVLVRATFHAGTIVRPEGRQEQPGRANYFLGNEPMRWRSGVPTYGEVVYANVWPGISVKYSATAVGVKYSYEVDAGADIQSIAIAYEGADRVRLAGQELVVMTELGELRDSPPIAEQNGRPVECTFRPLDRWTVGLSCPTWDDSRPGVIDPLVWATYLGASGRDDLRSVAVDAAGSVYVAGHTGSIDFPATPGAFRTAYGGGFYDVFVAKFRPGGDVLEWASYLGGAGEEYALSLAQDSAGVYVTGYTTSADFPTEAALDPMWNNTDAFVAKLAPSGDVLVFSTFLGGTGEDAGEALAVGTDGSVFVSGITGSMDFPTTPGAPAPTHNGGFFDAFVAKLDPTGASLAYGTYLGGSRIDSSVALAVDETGAAYVTGGTISTNFPTTPGAYDRVHNDFGPMPSGDAFLTKLNASGTGYAYSTFLGGAVADSGWGVRVDRGGRAYVVGYTESSNFPTTPGARYETYIAGGDAFVVALSPAGDALASSTFMGGTGADQPFALQLDGLGRPIIAGSTTSADFPVTSGAPFPVLSGGRDAFVVHLDASLSTILLGSFFGGSNHDDLYALAIDPYGHAYLGGLTLSTDLPTTPGAYDRTCGTDGTCDFDGVQTYIDGFLAKVKIANPVTANVTVATVPSGRQVVIDGVTHTAPHTFGCIVGTHHALDVPSPQVVGSTRYLFALWSDGGARAHTIACDDTTLTVTFLTQHEIIVASTPPGLTIVVDLTPVTAPASFWWLDGSSHSLNATSPQESGGTRRTFSDWSDLGARVHVITVARPQTYVARFYTEHNVSIATDPAPAGLMVEIDTVPRFTPFSFWCLEGSQHALNATSPQRSGPVQYLFRTWSDTGAQSRTISCTVPLTLTASYDTEYAVTVDTSPHLLQVMVEGIPFTAPWTFWCPANAPRTIGVASPQGGGLTRYALASWSDGLSRLHTVTCTVPATYVAIFNTEHWIEVHSSPPGLRVAVDGVTTDAPAGSWWREGSSHSLDAPTPQFGTDTRYTFAAWLDGPTGSRTIFATGPTSYVARFDVAYSVALTTDPPGLQLLVDGHLVAAPFEDWWLSGSAHTVSAPSPQIGTPGVRHVFDAWDDGGDQVRLIQVGGPPRLTAAFGIQYRLSLSSFFGTPTCDKVDCWYGPGDIASFSMDTVANAGVGTRYAFDRWSGNVSQGEANGTILMDGPKYGVAAWRTEYFLRVDSPYGTATGEGWYAHGARATFSVSPAEVVSGGRRFLFHAWGGDASSETQSASVVMDRPLVVTAEWREGADWSWLLISLAVVLVLVLFLLARRRKDEDDPPSESKPKARVAAFTDALRTRIRPRR